MKRFLLDLNVLLDVILDRKPGVLAAARLWARLEQGDGEGVIPAHGVTTVYYILEKARGAGFARQAVEQLLRVFAVAPLTQDVLRRALVLAGPDFEDAVCAASAEAAGCDALVSRNTTDFPEPPLPVVDPGAALGLLGRT